jgi:hypothetical protein
MPTLITSPFPDQAPIFHGQPCISRDLTLVVAVGEFPIKEVFYSEMTHHHTMKSE